MSDKIITRFPPSPTGNFHLGSARTALFNFLFAKKNGGKFIVRFEDTDTLRSKREFEKDILDGLSWLGIDSDVPPTRQSERREVYATYLSTLIKKGNAYEGEKSEKGEGHVIRFKNPNQKVTWHDLIRGDVTFDTTELGDFVIAKNIHEPLYHLAVVIDDGEAGVTHVIRGEDHISNTSRQLLLIRALEFTEPHYAHIPLILGKDRSKLSKRHGATSVIEYRKEGYLSDAFVNYLALLGWHPSDEREIFSREELIAAFDLSRVQKGGAIFDEEKLRWVNGEHLSRLSNAAFRDWILGAIDQKYDTPILDALIPTLRERVKTYNDIHASDIDYFYSRPDCDVEKLSWKDTDSEVTKKHLMEVERILATLSLFTTDAIREALSPYSEKVGRGEVLWPLRYALSGQEKSPDPFTIAGILGKDEALVRIKTAYHKL